MPSNQELLFRTLKLLVLVYILLCMAMYFFQERFIFFPQKLDKDVPFTFDQPFEEVYISTKDNKKLNGLLFTTPAAQGLIFYLHGNSGALDSWGTVAKTYTALGYAVFLLDYRGFGKSEGSITSQSQFFEDVQAAYDQMKQRYPEERITVLGYSIGTGPAAHLAATNRPRLLLLQAPYYSLTDMMRHTYPILPRFLLKYPFQTNQYVKRCAMPVVLIHGDQDEVIYYRSSLKLKAELKSTDTLITLKGQGHNGLTDHPQYVSIIRQLLAD